MRIAVLSDIHGNVPALDAVLEDIERHGVEAIVCLGDHVSGPIDPAGAAERVMALDATAIRGNHDRWVVDPSLRHEPWSVDEYARAQLSAHQMGWLASLPATAKLGDAVFLCHGTPSSDEKPWLDNFFDGRNTVLPSEAEVEREAVGLDQPVILCGHTHIARTLRLSDGRLLVNPGSVGMQMVRGSPDAHYAIVERRLGKWQTALISVPYDTEAAARLAKENGFADWGDAIRFGWVGPESLG
ncbi:metallophosphoesterase family protein [Devosia marina]|uniref:Metallophosphoesterase n=1 Tax=Devosia marina TaxID=2683198 RepID=A0A7X3K560_9HYPH|nr:metallophosphoesterase family protein [Devosia marina]MVT00629.1 metallophosphoesterase [Devosia marina]